MSFIQLLSGYECYRLLTVNPDVSVIGPSLNGKEQQTNGRKQDTSTLRFTLWKVSPG